ncbi:Crossover junction endonuclease EME1B [Vitis vinifera]|uniref:Crossover junction endonuclease EME1B n=1 Tax=Vitis vinifera TaxID=29760 RepID=A0A438F5I7_VITVI|nr:Crossover junction endonuclease EME1B [Vitis vinifera]
MAEPISLHILSDDDQDPSSLHSTPLPIQSKKRRTEDCDPISTLPYPTILIIDDDPTPRKPGSDSTPSFVAETPLSGLSKSDVSIVKCTYASSNPEVRVSTSDQKFAEISRLICLESDNESENGIGRGNLKENENETTCVDSNVLKVSDLSSQFVEPACSPGSVNETWMYRDGCNVPTFLEDDIHQVEDHSDKENVGLEQKDDVLKQKSTIEVNAEKKKRMDRAMGTKNQKKEERIRLMEEKKLKKQEEKLQKAALKAEAAELKKLQKEKQKWEKGKLALKSIVAQIDTKVIELGSIGGHLLSRFAEKGLTFRVTSNPIARSIVWTMTVPEQISQLSPEGMEIPYVLLIYEAEEFCNLVTNESLMDHVLGVRSHYPSHTVCYLTNREQGHYKNPTNSSSWRRPPVEEVLSKLTTHFLRVHSRQCIDEAELAEHVVGLTCSLASCQFRKKLTRLSVNANGSLIPKDSTDRNLIKKSVWLKALVAIPKVQPRFAIAIWKKYPTMKSLLRVYMDPNPNRLLGKGYAGTFRDMFVLLGLEGGGGRNYKLDKFRTRNGALVGKEKTKLRKATLRMDTFHILFELSFGFHEDPFPSVHEKEFLLKDLTTEGLLGEDRRLGEVCSKRVYRILMAQSGNMKTDDVEDGADFFRHQSS